MKLEIKAGKEYKTRDGRKVVIYATDKGGDYPVHGSILLSDSTWGMESWTLDGVYSLTNGNGRDIISEWTEPLDFDWDCLPKWSDRGIAMDKDGTWYCYDTKPSILDQSSWDIETGNPLPIPVAYIPKDYKGNWANSLHENPKYKS